MATTRPPTRPIRRARPRRPICSKSIRRSEMFRPTLSSTSLLAIALCAAMPARADDEALRKELDALRAQVAALKAEVDQMKAAPAATPVAAQPVIASTP